jgi:hypothetical protein
VRDASEIVPQTEPAAVVSISKPASPPAVNGFGDHLNGSSGPQSYS